MGDFVGVVALAVLVYAETGSAMATSALFIAGQFAPSFLGPLAIARVDQLPLRAVLPSLYAAEAAAFAALALLADSFSLLPVLVLACTDGVLRLTARGLTRGAVNAVLAPGLLREGNALLNVAFAASNVGGTALGGLLVHVSSVSTALWVDAGVVRGHRRNPRQRPGVPACARRTGALPRAHPRRAGVRAREPAGPHPPGRTVRRPGALHLDRSDRGRLRGEDAPR